MSEQTYDKPHDPKKRAFTVEIVSFLQIGKRQAERRFAQIRGFNGIARDGIVRWCHVYAWEDAKNAGLLKNKKVKP